MNKVRVATAVVAGLSLAGGLGAVAGASSSSVTGTGPDSQNHVTFSNSQDLHVDNDNNLSATNNNPQFAGSGSSEVEHNTTGGDAGTGVASNSSGLKADVTVDNSGGMGASAVDPSGTGDTGNIDNTGPDSNNKISFDNSSNIRVENNNTLKITNNVSQIAKSGSAKVNDNTTGGNATSGDATNASTTEVTFKVTN